MSWPQKYCVQQKMTERPTGLTPQEAFYAREVLEEALGTLQLLSLGASPDAQNRLEKLCEHLVVEIGILRIQEVS